MNPVADQIINKRRFDISWINICFIMKEKQKAALGGIGCGMNLAGEALNAVVMVKAYNLEAEMEVQFNDSIDHVIKMENKMKKSVRR